MTEIRHDGASHDEPGGGRGLLPPVDEGQVTTVELGEREGLAIVSRGFARQTFDRFRRHRIAMFAVSLLLLCIVAFWIGPLLSPHSSRALGAVDMQNARPSLSHLFGNDQLGRDLLVRVFEGGQFSIRIALIVSVLTTIIGTVIGALSGYFGGWVDAVLNQLTNLVLIVPALVILLVLAKNYGASPNGIAVILALLLWPVIARIVRGLFLQAKEQEFVLAARAAGARAPRIMFRHIIPNTFGPIVVNATLLISTAIILESTLSFLGLGVQPPTPTLGNLVAESKGSIESHPHRLLFPAGFIVLISLCINFIGDGLRDALDPTSRKG